LEEGELNMSDKEAPIGSGDILWDNGIYFFMDGVHAKSCKEAINFIVRQNLQPKKLKRLQIMINSPGGSVTACLALVDVMKGSKIPIHTTGLGMIASCGILLFMAGEKGHRVLTPNTSILSHQYSWGSQGKEHELFATVKEMQMTSDRLLKHYKKCTGLTEKTIKTYLLPPEDVWLTPQQAKKFGIADHIRKVY
jgi:ATP-dependent Clp protease protease subunit